MSLSGLIIIATFLLFISGSIMLILTVVQQNMSKGVRLVTLAVLPGPLLATCVSSVVWILTHSLLWGIVTGVASYVLAMITALPVQDLVISLWNRARTIINQLKRIKE